MTFWLAVFIKWISAFFTLNFIANPVIVIIKIGIISDTVTITVYIFRFIIREMIFTIFNTITITIGVVACTMCDSFRRLIRSIPSMSGR